MPDIANIKVGRPQAKPTTPSHVPGVRGGNEVGSLHREKGIEPRGRGAVGSARRSTGINPGAREPIDPRSPKLSPA